MVKTISEVKEIGWSALVERLGASGATLFILEYEKGYGDYTKDRRKIFDKKLLEEIIEEIKERVNIK